MMMTLGSRSRKLQLMMSSHSMPLSSHSMMMFMMTRSSRSDQQRKTQPDDDSTNLYIRRTDDASANRHSTASPMIRLQPGPLQTQDNAACGRQMYVNSMKFNEMWLGFPIQ
jgi:hypothetical protein